MVVLTRRAFLAAGGSALSTFALTKKRRSVGDWNPTALWRSTDLWGAH